MAATKTRRRRPTAERQREQTVQLQRLRARIERLNSELTELSGEGEASRKAAAERRAELVALGRSAAWRGRRMMIPLASMGAAQVLAWAGPTFLGYGPGVGLAALAAGGAGVATWKLTGKRRARTARTR